MRDAGERFRDLYRDRLGKYMGSEGIGVGIR